MADPHSTPDPQPAPQYPQQYQAAPQFGPLSFGQIFTRAFSLLKQNPAPLLLIAVLIPFAANFIMTVLTDYAQARTNQLAGAQYAMEYAETALAALGAALLQGIVALFVGIFAQGYTLSNLRHTVLGRRASIGEIWATLVPALGRLIGFSLMLILIALGFGVAIGIIVVIAVVASIGTSSTGELSVGGGLVVFGLGFLTTLAALVPLIWISTKLSLASPLIIFERAGTFPAMKRSWQLTRGRFWKIFGVQLVIGLIVGFASFIISVFILIPPTLSNLNDVTQLTDPQTSLAQTLLTAFPTSLITAFGTVVSVNAIGLLYLDARVRTDWLASSLNAYAAARASGVPATQLPDPFVSPPASGSGAGVQQPGAPAPGQPGPEAPGPQ